MKQYPYRAILFDLDDTLTATSAAFQKAYRDFSEQYPDIYLAGNEEEIAAVRHIVYHIPRHEKEQKDVLYPPFCKKWGIWNAPPTEREFEAQWRTRQCENLELFPWSVDVLADLKQKGLRMSLVTNGWSYFQRMKLEKINISDYFEEILIAEEVGIDKPDPAIFRLAADRMGLSVSDCLFVGNDPTKDVVGALTAGMDCLWIAKEENTVGATYTAPDIRYLKKLFS